MFINQMIQYRARTNNPLQKNGGKNKTKHTCHQKMQGWGRLRAILRTEGRWEGALSVPQNHWEEVKLRELPPESVLGKVK